VLVETVEAALPEPPVRLHPLRDARQRRGLQPARPLLRVAAPADQPGAFEDLQVLGDRRHAHRERLGQLGDGGLAAGQPREDRTPGGVGQRPEHDVQLIVDHVSNLPVN
jgi:hypothetical protein